MNRYEVVVTQMMTYAIKIAAKNEKEAFEKAQFKLSGYGLKKMEKHLITEGEQKLETITQL